MEGIAVILCVLLIVALATTGFIWWLYVLTEGWNKVMKP